MLVTLMVIIYILVEISTPSWQRNDRQTTYQFFEAMQEAENVNTSSN